MKVAAVRKSVELRVTVNINTVIFMENFSPAKLSDFLIHVRLRRKRISIYSSETFSAKSTNELAGISEKLFNNWTPDGNTKPLAHQ